MSLNSPLYEGSSRNEVLHREAVKFAPSSLMKMGVTFLLHFCKYLCPAWSHLWATIAPKPPLGWTREWGREGWMGSFLSPTHSAPPHEGWKVRRNSRHLLCWKRWGWQLEKIKKIKLSLHATSLGNNKTYLQQILYFCLNSPSQRAIHVWYFDA